MLPNTYSLPFLFPVHVHVCTVCCIEVLTVYTRFRFTEQWSWGGRRPPVYHWRWHVPLPGGGHYGPPWSIHRGNHRQQPTPQQPQQPVHTGAGADRPHRAGHAAARPVTGRRRRWGLGTGGSTIRPFPADFFIRIFLKSLLIFICCENHINL